MALGVTTSPAAVFSASTQKRSASHERGKRRGSLPFNIGPIPKPVTPFESPSWLVRRLASLLRRTPTEGGDEGVTTNHSRKSHDECCMQCRQAFDETVQRWTTEDECSIDPSTVYRQQLRAMLQEESSGMDFTETDLKTLTRSLSEGDLGREDDDDTNEAIDSLIERYGLMSGDFAEALCVPEGTVLGEDECYVTNVFLERLPDHLSSALSPPSEINEIEAVSVDSSTTAKYNLNSPLWARFDLFSKDEYTSWHDKYRHEKLSSKVVKKQDAIFELILIEKSHCAHLAFLQQGYRNRLLQENILLEADLNRLIPDVLDALLVFHLNLLDRLTTRQRESDEVETISDILAEELSDDGKHISVAVNAYTTFGSSKERSEKMFESLMAKNARFAEFIKTSSQDPLYRRYEFKSTMTRVISRPAKYGLLVETILKNEYNKFTKESELTQKALVAAKRFAMKIDNNLLVAQMAQRWDDVRSHFDHSSHTNLYLVDKEKPSGAVRITFTEQSVFPVSGLILRPADRSASVMIISGAITKPALLEVEFNSKSDRTKWIKTLETAIHSAPVKVRMSPRNEDEAARQLEIERQLQVKRQKEAEDAWLRKLDEMFEQRNSQERIIQDYMMSLMKFFDELRAHLHTLPLKARPDIADRIREAVRQHCRELRICRTAPLNRMIENACVARESELWSFIDVTAEMGLDGTPDSDGGGSSSDSSGSGRRPRRIHTFHGTTGPSSGHESTIRRHTTVPRMSIGQETGDKSDDEDERWELSEERREQLEVDEKTHRLPLGLNLKARRAMTHLIRDVVKLKTENNQLRNEISLNRTRLAMKERTQNVAAPSSLASDTMEALRRKEQELREEDARRRRELEQLAEQLREQQERQKQQEAQLMIEREQLRRSEAELAEKWAALHAASEGSCGTPNARIVGRISMKSPSSVGRVASFRDPKASTASAQPAGISPALRNLTKKSEVVKKTKK
ncbi:RhoGEF domain protein [Teladorsagia circumcincta]|uniref:RhoGEF domain protein n=1 Tax=Teladorsagia circumcincta TaxID=45464 RepID=A0A2G9V5I8_TELCI|nr:RhoGEF domain protein [Teladorsagia circumcincta]